MTFEKILIANRGDKRPVRTLAVEAHAGIAGVMPEPKRLAPAGRGDRGAAS